MFQARFYIFSLLVAMLLSGCYTKFSSSRPSEAFLGNETYSYIPDYPGVDSTWRDQSPFGSVTIHNYYGGYGWHSRPYYSLSQWHYGWYDPFYDPLWPRYTTYIGSWRSGFYYAGFPYYYPWHWHGNNWYYSPAATSIKEPQNFRSWGRMRSGVVPATRNASGNVSTRTRGSSGEQINNQSGSSRVSQGKKSDQKNQSSKSTRRARISTRQYQPKQQSQSSEPVVVPRSKTPSRRTFSQPSESESRSGESQNRSRPSTRSR